MPRAFTPKIITANALLEGDVVYLTANDDWSRALADAEVLDDETHAELRLVEAAMQVDLVVGVYLADVAPGPAPVHFREAFRARGPSNYPHGKQVDQ